MGWGKGLEVISNFTETGRATPIAREMLETPKDAFVVSSMGRFVPRKGFDVLIRAVSMHKNMILWLIGGGEEEKNLRALAEQLNVADRVRFAGWQKDPLPFVSASNCFAMASSHEPLGNVILEAWAQKVPVVSTRSEGPNWFMRHEENGLLVDIGDHQGFAAAFRRLEVESALTSSIVEGGTRTLAQQFSEDAVVGAYMSVGV
jgi:glycosyltransferase involved in cell wall biosynthesis